ncbi:ADP-ribose pyrophosphatase [Paractinoplanes brasiliensis]|uniref:ADP-ribose pyrophosphatase n=2 Tax=Paractinoplanes brasiliensis TaxID=52695 RepID=A0A4R6JY32_9ACTN|nr:ADP-ribose pyrophosphatase [Actinoplanes brasiliensis]GID29980.1 ADP-ribose pyrophosphatase [Actinoplanes brasiliensis]
MSFEHSVMSRVARYEGPIFKVFTDEVTMSSGSTAHRDVVKNKGAVGVVALDEVGRVVLIRQYRHAVGQRLWELPAGLRDVEGEDLARTAARELAEEADLEAGQYHLLIDLFTSPGFSDETIRIFLARDLSSVPDESRFERADEEADLEVARIDLDEAVAMVFRGEITNAAAVGGLLAAARARDEGWATLRPAS